MAIIGLGHVGLPTAVIFANAGFQVVGADLNKEIINAVSAGKSHIKEPKLTNLVKLAVKNGNLRVTNDSQQATKEADIVIISVQTPITKDLEPDQTFLIKACEAVAKELSKGKLVIIRSTVSPGTTENLVARIIEKGSGLKCGEDFWLAHCPERMAPGRAIKEFEENIIVVGGYNSESSEVAIELFKTVTKGEVKTADCICSEVTKLVENTFRDVNIALANEIALICEKIGTDVMEIIKAPPETENDPVVEELPTTLIFRTLGSNDVYDVYRPPHDIQCIFHDSDSSSFSLDCQHWGIGYYFRTGDFVVGDTYRINEIRYTCSSKDSGVILLTRI